MNKQTQEQPQTSTFYFPRLSEYADAFSRIMRELKNIGASPGQIIGLLKNDGRPPDDSGADAAQLELELDFSIGIPVTPPVSVSQHRQLYTARQIARRLGVYSMYGRPHAHAISAILNNNLFIDDEHFEEQILFETGNVTVFYTRYDEYALGQVRDWLSSNDLPYEVDGYCYTYHIRYR